MRVLTSKDGDLLCHFDKSHECQPEVGETPQKPFLINNHDIDANKGKIKGHSTSEHIFDFCK